MIKDVFPDSFGLDSISDDSLIELEDFVNHRTKILEEKLGVLIFEIKRGLKLKDDAQLSLDNEKSRIEDKIHELSAKSNYDFNKLKEKDSLQEKIFGLNKEKREREIEHWKSNIILMRNFLEVWDEYGQARAKGRVLKDVR